VMKAADVRDRDDPATRRGFYSSWLRTVVVERLVWPRGVVVANVAAQESAEMVLAENEEMIQALAADGADHALCKGVLPRRARGDADLADPQPFDATGEVLTVDRVSIPEEVSRRRFLWKHLDQLARHPEGRGVLGNIDAKEFAAVVAEDDEDKEQAEGEGGDNEEVDGDELSGMRGEEGAPGRRGPRRHPGMYLATVSSATAWPSRASSA
jgi:hypothetical protein